MQSHSRRWRMALACAILALGALAPAWAAPPRSLLRVDERFRDAPGAEQYPRAAVLFLLDHIGFELEPDGHTVYTEHDAIKLLNEEGAEGYGTLVRIYRRGFESLQVVQARTIGPDGGVTDVPAEAIQDAPLLPDAPLYADYRRLTVTFPEAKPGSVVEFQLRTRRAPRPDGRWWASSYVQNPDPILHSTYTVKVPEGTDFRWAAPGVAQGRPQESRDGGTRLLKWEVRDVPALQAEPAMPEMDLVLQRVEVSNFPDWCSIGNWLAPRWEAALADAEGVDIVASGVTSAADPLPQRIQAVLDWAAAGRTVTTSVPENFQPHSAREVLDARTLTPMDMAVLLAAVLGRVGVPAQPVLASPLPLADLEPGLPAPEAVDRILLALPSGDGSFLWVDPASPGMLLSSPPAGAQEVGVVRLAPSGAVMAATPASDPDENLRDVRIDARLQPDAGGELTMTLSARGLAGALWTGLIRELASSPNAEREELLGRLFGFLAQGFVAEGRVYSHFFPESVDPEQPFQLSVTMMFGDLASPDAEGKALSLPLPLYAGDRLVAFGQEGGPRRFPVHFDYPFRDDVRVHLTLPQGSRVQSLPEPVSVETPVGTYFATVRQEGLEVWFYSRLVVDRAWVGPDEFGHLRRLAEAQTRMLANPLIFVPPAVAPNPAPEEP